jgi:hypothetical protein
MPPTALKFWSEPATADQKRIIVSTIRELGMLRRLQSFVIAEIHDERIWPTPFRIWPTEFNRWDAYLMIGRLEKMLKGDL